MKSNQAIVATLIRKELKEKIKNVTFRVKSCSASMMTAVDIYYPANTNKKIIAKVNKIISKYEYEKGLDSTDCPITSHRDDIPQVRFVSLHKEYN